MNTTDIEKMREVGKLTSLCLNEIATIIKPGISTWDINNYVVYFETRYSLRNAQFAYKNREGGLFPGHCCTSVNHVICHGIPSKDKILKDGDIIKVDVTFSKDGWHGDSCRTYEVGKVSIKAQKVIDAAKSAMFLGISQCQPGNKIGMIGKAIEEYIYSINMTVVKDFSGHGIGRNMHQPPWIPHYYDPNNHQNEVIIEEGMTFTVEPMINFGKQDYKLLNDGWSFVTRDRSLSAQFEHTILITNDAPEILT